MRSADDCDRDARIQEGLFASFVMVLPATAANLVTLDHPKIATLELLSAWAKWAEDAGANPAILALMRFRGRPADSAGTLITPSPVIGAPSARILSGSTGELTTPTSISLGTLGTTLGKSLSPIIASASGQLGGGVMDWLVPPGCPVPLEPGEGLVFRLINASGVTSHRLIVGARWREVTP